MPYRWAVAVGKGESMKFSDIIGQGMLVNSLQTIIQESKAANGYIFTGPKGSGKKRMAYTFALGLNCRGEGEERPCGICHTCIRFMSENHPNIEIIKPTGASIKIKQIKQLIQDVSKKPFETGYKVVILEHADKMTHEAQDAFLKTLEEPPANTIFILLVENQHALLSTVVSRCQVYSLRKVPEKEIEKYLRSQFKMPDSEIKLATVSSNGIIGRAIEILEDKNFFKLRNEYFMIIDQLFKNSFTAVSLLAAMNIDSRLGDEDFTDFLMTWFRDIMIYRELPEGYTDLIVNIDRVEDIERHSILLREDMLNDILEIIKQNAEYIRHNVSIKNGVDGMLLNMTEVCNGKNSWGKIQKSREDILF